MGEEREGKEKDGGEGKRFWYKKTVIPKMKVIDTRNLKRLDQEVKPTHWTSDCVFHFQSLHTHTQCIKNQEYFPGCISGDDYIDV
jgi:hypothetical protein